LVFLFFCFIFIFFFVSRPQTSLASYFLLSLGYYVFRVATERLKKKESYRLTDAYKGRRA